MPTNKNVLIDRQKFIGSSEISAILGISPFKDRYSLLLEKAELKEPDIVDNPYVDFGNEIEKYIRDYINKDYQNDPFVEDTIIKERDVINYRCNYDGKNKTMGLEIKSTSHICKNVRDYKHYIVQLLWGMMLARLDKGILAVYKRNEDFVVDFQPERLTIYEIDINDYDDWVSEIKLGVQNFVNDLQKLKENPMLSEEDLLPIDLSQYSTKLAIIEDKLKEYDKLVAEQKMLKSELKKAMEEHGIKKWTTNDGTQITLLPDGEDKIVQKFNAEALKEENPDMYNAYLEDVIQKGKVGYVKITYPKGEK